MKANRIHRVQVRFFTAFGFLAFLALSTLPSVAQAAQSTKGDRWLHVRVVSKDSSGDTVRVNVPLELAIKILPSINQRHLHGGRVEICETHMDDIDLRALLEAVRTTKDGEFVTVQGRDDEVRVAKENGYLLVHVRERKGERKRERGEGKNDREHRAEVRVPMTVVNALLSGGKNELDLVAAMHALAEHPDTELVTVQDEESTVRIWLDSKNTGD